MKIILDLNLPGPLHAELQEAAKEAQCNPEVFAGECVQSILASRRLPRLRPAPHGARIAIEDAG
jgi:hypothetical protein